MSLTGCPAVCPEEWTKINEEGKGVAWGARDDSYGKWHVPTRVCGRRLKLQHRSGGVSCSDKGGVSNFGCGASSDSSHIAVYVTAGKDPGDAIVPRPGDPKVKFQGMQWKGMYFLSGFSSMSPYLELDLPMIIDNSYFCFEEGTEYQLWYGEDMYDYAESDNGGTAYTDIYIMS